MNIKKFENAKKLIKDYKKVNQDLRDSQFQFITLQILREVRILIKFCHDFNIPPFKFPKSSLSELFESHCSLELPEAHLYLNYSNFNSHLNYSKFNVHLNYSTFKFYFNFRHLNFHLNYSIIALDLMFKKSNIEYRVLKINER